jgi:hypothetical protein
MTRAHSARATKRSLNRRPMVSEKREVRYCFDAVCANYQVCKDSGVRLGIADVMRRRNMVA